MPPFADPERWDIAFTLADGPAVAPEAVELPPASPRVAPFGCAAPGFDADTAFLFNATRGSDPTQGRWVSHDPISFEADDMNLYRYPGQDGGDDALSWEAEQDANGAPRSEIRR
jgi:RHS repeat-associated protein